MQTGALVGSAEKSLGLPEEARELRLHIDPEMFRVNFNRRPFRISHELADHPLFRLPELVELSKRLPAENVKYNRADIPTGTALFKGPQTGLSVEDTVRQIEECKSWMVLRRVQVDPLYRELLDPCLDEIQRLSEPMDPGMCIREGFIFIASPSVVTPYHMDPEYNFLLQIRGQKTIHLFDGSDRSILSEQEIEEFVTSSFEHNVEFKDEYEAKSSVFELAPGDGLHFPVNAPHWVKNGDQVSVSFSITFRTAASERRNTVYELNMRLRRLGIEPMPFGRSRLRDWTKCHAYRTWTRGRRLITGRRSQPSTGSGY